MQAPKPTLPNSAYALDFSGVSAPEQLMVELVNRARLNPEGEDGRQSTNYISGGTSAQAVAIVGPLSDAAQRHSDDMLRQGFFAHTNPFSGSTPSDRARDAGYGAGAAENIALGGGFEANKFSAQTIQGHHAQFWNSGGHRNNFLNTRWSEVGIGQSAGDLVGDIASYGNNRSLVTQNFGDRGLTYLTGVVIDDNDGDAFYDIGEGQGAVRITAWNASGSAATSTWEAGGYSLALEAGTYTVEFSGGDLKGTFTTQVTIGSDNIKLDVIEDRDVTAPENPSPSPTPPAETPAPPTAVNFYGDDGDNQLTGTAANNLIVARKGNDTLWGEAGADTLKAGAGDDTLYGGGGNDTLIAHKGNDTAHGGAGYDTIKAGGGDDVVKGGKGNDRIDGGRGDDNVNGGQGADRIAGDKGNDKLTGRAGDDTFVYANGDAKDRITDFRTGADQLLLDEALWNGTLTAAQVVDRHASETDSGVVFDFGGGDMLTLNGVTSLDALSDDIGFL